MEQIVVLVVVLVFAFGVGKLGENRKIGFGWAFAISLFLSPIIGLIVVLCSKKNSDVDFVDANDKNVV